MKTQLFLTNTLTQHKDLFVPIDQSEVFLYVCGVTPYDYAHIGHGRCYVTFDLLYRLLTFLNYKVKYCRNFTDIDDKLLARAQKEFNDSHRYKELASKFIKAYEQDMTALNCLPPAVEPRVTDNIQLIIDFIKDLIACNKAYESEGDVYFSIESFTSYGKLSKRNIDDLLSGARVNIKENKRNPLDFALWKSEKDPKNVSWQSPWGLGRPGWHIECSALAKEYLASQIDIHGGGMDLIFPHHENEIAQTEALTCKEFARYWVHNAFVRIDKEKMSKSLDNFFTLRDVLKRYSPMVLRYYILTHHYRSPLDFSFEDLEAVQKSYQRLCKFFANYNLITQDQLREELKKSKLGQELISFILDDLNTPGLLGVIFENIKALTDQDAHIFKAVLFYILGLTLEPLPEKSVAITPEIQQLIEEREAARIAKDWKKSDEIRDKLKAMGVGLQDKKI